MTDVLIKKDKSGHRHTHTHTRKRPHEQKCRDHGDVSIRHELQEIPSKPLETRREAWNRSFSTACRGSMALPTHSSWTLLLLMLKSLNHVQLFGDPTDCSPPGSSVHGILQERICVSCLFPLQGNLLNPGIKPESPASAGRFSTTEPPEKPMILDYAVLWCA